MKQSVTVFEALSWASSFLKEYGREAFVANVLLAYHLQIDSSELHEQMNHVLPETIVEGFKKDIEKHVTTGLPIQHITGEAFFYGRSFHVNDHVLIPRYDTEFVLQAVIDYVHAHNEQKSFTIVDIGTGSGIIAVTLALELPEAIVYATDISEEALKVAKENARNFDANVTFLQGSYMQPVFEAEIKPTIIISNPPYIPLKQASMLTDTVKQYDPDQALYGGETGLEAYEEITRQVATLKPIPEVLAYEIGFDQAASVSRIIHEHFPQAESEIIQDFQPNDRVVFTKLKKEV